MNHRKRYLNTLRGHPVDRLPYVETAQFRMARARSDWNQHLAPSADPLTVFNFDNVSAPMGFEETPIDWYAVPRFDEIDVPSTDGYVRRVDGRYGRIVKALPKARAGGLNIRVFEDHVVGSRQDWQTVRERFQVSTTGRFPQEWRAWCEHSRVAPHPVVLEIRDPGAVIANLMGLEEDGGLMMSTVDRPDLLREMVAHYTDLNRICARKALTEAQVDMVMIGSDVLPMLGRNVVREFLLESYADSIALAKSCGVELICLQGRGDLRPQIAMFRHIGVNGIKCIMEIGDADYQQEIMDAWGDELFYLGGMDVRALLRGRDAVDAEIARKLEMARQYRMIPCLAATHVLPEVRFRDYQHYARRLWEGISPSSET
jgi:hypothetical protein